MKKLTLTFVLLLSIAFGASAQEGGGLFGRGFASVEEMEAEEAFYWDHGYRGAFICPPYGGYNIGTEIFGSDTYGGYNIYTQQFGYEGTETPLGSGYLVLTLAGAAYAIRKRKNNKKTINKMKSANTFIIAAVLLLGLSQCKKNELPETPELEGNQVYISVSVNGGSKHIVYPELGVYFFENGDKLYVGNHGQYVGTLEYSAGVFSGVIEIGDTIAAAYRDYLHFYFIGGAYTGELNASGTDITTSFEWSIADQTGSKLPILSYGHSTQKFSRKVSAYSCMLENKCGLLKFRAWPAPSDILSPVTISGMKTTAVISFDTINPGITPKDATGEDITLHHVSGTDAAERWAILLPQEAHETTVSYVSGNQNITKTISLPTIKANTYYGGYNGIPVGLEYVDLGLSVLWAACNVGSCTQEGYGKFFAWADIAPKSAYCWSHYPYAQDPDPTDGDTIHWEWDSTYTEPGHQIKLKPNLWLTKYNTQDTWCPESSSYDNKTTLESVDDAALAIMGEGWRTPTKAEWEELIAGTTPTREVVNGIGGIRFTSKENGNSIFLPFAGYYSGPQHSAYYTSGNLPVGEYWSKEIDSEKPYQAYSLYFDDPDFEGGGGDMEHLGVKSADDSGSDDVGFIRYEGRPVRAVRSKN